MQTRPLWMVLGVFCCATLLPASAAEATNTASLSATLTLTDGSQVRGTPELRELPLQTSYAAMVVPLEKIRDIAFATNPAAAVTVTLVNGDRLSATCTLKEVKLAALFGKISVPMSVLKRMAVSARASGTLPREGLVLWYDFHHFDGSEVLDMSDREHHGKLFSGARIIDDAERGQVLSLDGQAAHVRVPGSPDFHFTNFTAVVWLKRSSWDIPHEDPQPIFCTGTPTGREGGILLGLGEGPQLGWTFRPFSDLAAPGWNADLDFEANDTSWHQLALTMYFEDGRCLMRAYKDGSLLKEVTATSAVPAYRNQMLYIGINYDSPAAERGMNYSRQFKGCFSDYMVFDRALSAAEIAALFGAPLSPTTKPTSMPVPQNSRRPSVVE
ncbi:MAG: LamG domain-containing protein [Kiritimatiellaeota bacterium]|nr:LamG domain-containing protein [Kiritimatiellota bacterium]